MLKFRKVSNIQPIDVYGKPLPMREGYRAGPFTIHRDEVMRNWVLSAGNGWRLIGAWWLENAKAAAQEYAKLPLPWDAPIERMTEEVKKGNNWPKMREIRDKYTGTHKVTKA